MKPKDRMYARNNVIDQLEDGYLYISTSGDGEEVAYVIELVKKDIPKKPYYEGDGYADGAMVYDMAYCPNCGNLMEEYKDNGWGEEYCHCCGQHLDWSD